MIKNNQNEKGAVIYFAVLLLGILFSAGVTVTTILIQQINRIENMSYSVSAFYAADAGIEKVLYRWGDIGEDTEIINWDTTYDGTLSEGQKYVLSRRVEEEELIIVSVGQFLPHEGVDAIKRGIQITRPR